MRGAGFFLLFAAGAAGVIYWLHTRNQSNVAGLSATSSVATQIASPPPSNSTTLTPASNSPAVTHGLIVDTNPPAYSAAAGAGVPRISSPVSRVPVVRGGYTFSE